MQGKYKHTSTPRLKYTCLTRFWATVLNFSGLLRKGKGSHSGSQNDGLVWLTVVWLGHLRLVRVSPASIEWFFINILIRAFKVLRTIEHSWYKKCMAPLESFLPVLKLRWFCLFTGMSLSVPTVQWSTEAGSTGMETRTQWKQWSEQKSSTSGLG